jgi:hypothetical protein
MCIEKSHYLLFSIEGYLIVIFVPKKRCHGLQFVVSIFFCFDVLMKTNGTTTKALKHKGGE